MAAGNIDTGRSTELATMSSRVRVNDDVLFQELQGESVLLNLKSGMYFGMDTVGTRIWQLFATHELLSEIAQVIVAEYDVPEDRCSADLLALAADLERHGLVTVINV
jgi:hypothetical protein